MQYTFIAQSAIADHSITIFNLAGINIVDLFAAVRLADPLRRAIVLHSLLFAGTRLANGQGGFIRTAPDDNPLPAILLRHLSIFSIFSWTGAAWTSSASTGKASTDPHNRMNRFFAM